MSVWQVAYGILWVSVLFGTGPLSIVLALMLRKHTNAGPILAVGFGLSVVPAAALVLFILSLAGALHRP